MNTWTIAYRKPRANRYTRVTNWAGTWAQAVAAARLFAEANPGLDVHYLSSTDAEAAGYVVAEDIANILTDRGTRVRVIERGELPAEIIARIPAADVAQARWEAGEPVADPALTEDEAHAEALAICASIPVDGRPADVTALLVEAELKTDAHENLVLVRRAKALADSQAEHAQLMREGEAIRDANEREQIAAWWQRHGLDELPTITAADVLAARDADYDEAQRVGHDASRCRYACHRADGLAERLRDSRKTLRYAAAPEPAPAEPAAPVDLLVTFERIGRTGTTPAAALTLTVPADIADDADRVAHAVFRHCRQHLVSREFGVTVDLAAGTVALDGGRFGRGRIEPAR